MDKFLFTLFYLIILSYAFDCKEDWTSYRENQISLIEYFLALDGVLKYD